MATGGVAALSTDRHANRDAEPRALVARTAARQTAGPSATGSVTASQAAQQRCEVIELCRRQLNFADGLIVEEVGDLWEQRVGDRQLVDGLRRKRIDDV